MLVLHTRWCCHAVNVAGPCLPLVRHVGSLSKVDDVLKVAKGDLLEGDEMTAGDIELAVTTYHMMAAFGNEKKW